MITGFNTEIECDGKVFHVQTEDRGLDNPVIESLVYVGGEILCSRKNSYVELIVAGEADESVVLQRAEDQHRELLRQIQDGSLFRGEQIPFGWNFISNNSFDQVVMNFLRDEINLEKIQLEILEPETLRAGDRSTIRLAVKDVHSGRPVVGATIVVRLLGGPTSQELFSGCTDEEGRVAVDCELPARPGTKDAVVCEAQAGELTAEVRHKLSRVTRASV